jgi:hypothetical protein
MIQSPKLPAYIHSGKLHFSAKHAEMPERGGASQITYSWRLCLRNPPLLGHVVLDASLSPRQDIRCADYIGVVFVTTAYALEMRLRWPILGCHPIAVGTSAARVVRRHRD